MAHAQDGYVDPEKSMPPRVSHTFADHRRGSQLDTANAPIVEADTNQLKRGLHGRHMQMIVRSSEVQSRGWNMSNLSLGDWWSHWCRSFRGIGRRAVEWRAGQSRKLVPPSSWVFIRADYMAKLICFMIIGVMIQLMMQALAELAVMYPVNGAFYQYIVRFVDPSW
jgi:amino acid transporter